MIHINVPTHGPTQVAPMWTYYPDLLSKPVPRYTSYPTAADFHDDVGEAEQRAGLANIGEGEPLSLYVHIPYCREICWYCGCNTGAANRSHRLATYLERLSQEIDLVAGELEGRGRVARISFGGGSPNAISPQQFGDVVRHLKAAFPIDPSPIISVEIDPRGFDAEFAVAMADAGVTRASLGVQTFDATIQASIGRIQPRDIIESAVELLRASGVTSLNFDLMYGLPKQGTTALLDSLKASLDLGADRLAVFGYAHVPHIVPRQRRIEFSTLPSAAERFEQASVAHDWLIESGWMAVGFDHFAKPYDPLALAAREKRVRRNFQGFTDDGCQNLIGLGASAISRIPGCLVQNERNSGRYGLKVWASRLAAARGVATPPSELMRARRIESLLCQGMTHLQAVPDRVRVREALHSFEERGLLSWKGWELCLEEGALPYARSIASALDPWRAVSKNQFSNAV